MKNDQHKVSVLLVIVIFFSNFFSEVGKNVFDILTFIDISFYSSIDLSMNPFVGYHSSISVHVNMTHSSFLFLLFGPLVKLINS